MTTSYSFDAHTEVGPLRDGRCDAVLTEHYNIGKVPNGGYVMSVAFRGLSALLPHPDMLTLSGHYLAPTAPGPAQLHLDTVHTGRSTSCGMLRMVQDGKERARFLGTAGHFADAGSHAPDFSATAPAPDLPPPDACQLSGYIKGVTPRIVQRFETRYAPDSLQWMQGPADRPLRVAAWTRFEDGRPPDLCSLPLFADALFPTVFTRFGPAGWVPTLQLNLQFRRHPADGLLGTIFRTRHLTSGLFEEDGELWDCDGQLVALSRQLARLRLPPPS